MRPTAKMRFGPPPAEEQAKAAKAPANQPGEAAISVDAAFVAELRSQAVRALTQTRKERKSGDLEKAAREAYEAGERSLSAAPEGEPGFVVARVVGLAAKKEPLIPLAAIGLRLKVDGQEVDVTETDAQGFGRIPLPEEGGKTYELEASSPDCDVLACKRGKATPRAKPAHLIEVPFSDELAAVFERAEPWRTGLAEARRRRDLAENAIGPALDRQEKELEELIAELDKALC